MRSRVLIRIGWLLGVLILVGVPFGWWAFTPRDVRSSTGIESVRGTATSTILVVTYMAGAEGCADPGGVQVEEKADEIRLTASTISRDVRRFETTVCPAIGMIATSSVRLSAPLGDRQVTGITRGEHGAIQVQAPCVTSSPAAGTGGEPAQRDRAGCRGS